MPSSLGSLPDPLVTPQGTRVTSREQWEVVQRPYILKWFRDHVYGREPRMHLAHVAFRVTVQNNILQGKTIIRKDVEISIEGPHGVSVMHVLVFLPAAHGDQVPVFLVMYLRPSEVADPSQGSTSEFSPVHDLLRHGYGVATFYTDDLDPDVDDGFRNGVHGIFEPPGSKRPDHAWGTIAAWAWGASRVMDYLETDADVDASRVALVGHSRLGKTALWAAAMDRRIAMVVSSNSGCTGAAIARGKRGETIRDINTRFPHWFCENYKRFNGREGDLPVDQHMQLALIAPRLLYVTSASRDEWADPLAEFLSVTMQRPVYQLYGFQGLVSRGDPYPDIPLVADRIGYHVRTGDHGLTEFDWKCLIAFADTHL